jgi:plasmid stabilization system protein ParE
MIKLNFKRHRFPPEIIRHSIWLYARFTLSFRDVEDLLAERGLDVSYETVRRWFLKFGSTIAANLRRARPRPSDHWHLDEMVIVIRRKRYWLWRAVDNEGEVLDFLVQSRRNAKAAKKLKKKLRTRISRCADESENCRGSNRPDRRNTSSQSTRRHTTPSIISATSTDDPFTKNFEPHHSMFGKPRVPPPDHRSLPPKFPAAKFM